MHLFCLSLVLKLNYSVKVSALPLAILKQFYIKACFFNYKGKLYDEISYLQVKVTKHQKLSKWNLTNKGFWNRLIKKLL